MRTTTSFLLALPLLAGCGVKTSTHRRALDQIKLLEGQLSDATTRNDDQSRRITVLEADLTRVKADLDKRSSAPHGAERVRGDKQASDDELRRLREAQERRLAAYRDLQSRFKPMVAAGALEVQLRNGQMALKVPSGVLFPSGAADLSKEGRATLAKVAELLMGFKDRRFLVAGHTDNVPISTKKFKNNWLLSSARAVAVVELLIGAGFPEDRLAAAGYADEDPIGDNGTPHGRELNRRIEIILVPDPSELPSLAPETP